jgi:hypothetical protein
MKTVTRLTVMVHNHPRSILSINEKRDEVTLGLSSPYFVSKQGRLRKDGYIGPSKIIIPNTPPSKVIEHRYSIHPSRESKENINVIKQTQVLETGKTNISRHYTKAIKSGDAFAYIFSRRCGVLFDPALIPSGKFQDISLGPLDHSRYTLIYGLMVGAPNKLFNPSKNHPAEINIKQQEFINVGITIVWTFLGLATHPSFMTAHHETEPPAGEREKKLMDGLSPDECVSRFTTDAIDFRDEVLDRVARETDPLTAGILRRSAQFSRTGSVALHNLGASATLDKAEKA